MTGDECRAAGWRFVYSGRGFNWHHPADVPADGTDCTDMTEAEFEAYVMAREAEQANIRG